MTDPEQLLGYALANPDRASQIISGLASTSLEGRDRFTLTAMRGLLAAETEPSLGKVIASLRQTKNLAAAGGTDRLTNLVIGAPVELPEVEADPTDATSDPYSTGRLRVVDVLAFLDMVFPPRDMLLAPWLPQQGLVMVYAPRGLGKTHFSLGVAYAVASGGLFMRWQAPAPRGVLFIDGEMPARTLQERLAAIALSHDKEPAAPLRIVTPDLQPRGMIDLSRPEDQAELLPYLEDVSLIVIDNISTLCQTGRENEAEGWLPVQQWALQQRAAGRSVLFIHHSGKSGEQRGTSRREDVLDTVLALRRPGDYTPDKGATFEVHFEKARGLFGDDTKPFEAALITAPDGRQTWALQPLEDSTAEKVAALLNEGIPQQEIADLIGVSKGTVSKAKNKAREMGLLRPVS